MAAKGSSLSHMSRSLTLKIQMKTSDFCYLPSAAAAAALCSGSHQQHPLEWGSILSHRQAREPDPALQLASVWWSFLHIWNAHSWQPSGIGIVAGLSHTQPIVEPFCILSWKAQAEAHRQKDIEEERVCLSQLGFIPSNSFGEKKDLAIILEFDAQLLLRGDLVRHLRLLLEGESWNSRGESSAQSQ